MVIPIMTVFPVTQMDAIPDAEQEVPCDNVEAPMPIINDQYQYSNHRYFAELHQNISYLLF